MLHILPSHRPEVTPCCWWDFHIHTGLSHPDGTFTSRLLTNLTGLSHPDRTFTSRRDFRIQTTNQLASLPGLPASFVLVSTASVFSDFQCHFGLFERLMHNTVEPVIKGHLSLMFRAVTSQGFSYTSRQDFHNQGFSYMEIWRGKSQLKKAVLTDGWLLIRVVFRQGGLIRVICSQCGLFIGMVSGQSSGCLCSWWSVVRPVCIQGSLQSVWSVVKMVCTQGGLLSVWSVVRMD